MSSRSGYAAEADNHSDISPLRINDLLPQPRSTHAIVTSPRKVTPDRSSFQYCRPPTAG